MFHYKASFCPDNPFLFFGTPMEILTATPVIPLSVGDQLYLHHSPERCLSNLVSKTSNNRGSAAFQATSSSTNKWELFFSVYPASVFFNFWPLIFIHNARMFCPLVESEKSCQAGNYENRYLITRVLLFKTTLFYRNVRTWDSFAADLDFFPDVFIKKSGCSMVLQRGYQAVTFSKGLVAW